MTDSITYIVHNCFALRLGARVLLFDPPAPPMLTGAMEARIAEEIAGRDLALFVSHAHGDHFHPGFRDLARGAARSTFLLSHDAAKRLRRKGPDGTIPPPPEDLIVARPGERFATGGLAVECFRSNDAGCAYLIETEGRRVWFGGDLALWDWPDNDADEKVLLEGHFRSVLKDLSGRGRIDVAFSNFDGRLPSRTGAAEFVRVVKPRLFAPMHSFGNEADLADHAGELAHPDVALFAYRAPLERIALAGEK